MFRRALAAARPALLAPLLVVAALGLAGCGSKAERAEAYYQRAMALLAEGEPDRAAIEFRNVFRLDGTHKPARLAYARLLRDRGDTARALKQYAILVDQDRSDLAAHKELAALALSAGDFAAAAATARRAYEIDPADPEAQALKATADYRDGDRAAAVALARGALAAQPGNVTASLVVIADRMNADNPAGALALADAAIAAAPADAAPDEGLHLVRLAAIEALGDDDAVGAALDRMATLFPDNPAVTQAQVQWRLRRGDAAGAEAVLRARASADPTATEPALTVARFLYQTAGAAPARAELDRLADAAAAAGTDPLPFRRVRAGLDFAEGDQAAAIAGLDEVLAALPAGDAATDATRDVQVELAAMLGATGDAAGRDALVARVLAGDPEHVAALKLRARAAIDADDPARAIQDMRAALKEAPRDSEAMTIMAMAHEREGSHELAGERLARAVEASDRAPDESARYARFLMQDGRLELAEGVTTDALRRDRENRGLLALLGEIHAARGDWPRVGQVAEILRAQGDPEAVAIAARLETARLAAEGRTEETLAALRARAADGADPEAVAQLMQASVAAGDIAGAQAYVDAALARDPASRTTRLMQAGLMATRGETAGAEALYRALIAEDPAEPRPHRALFALLASQGESAAADAALDAGIAATATTAATTAARTAAETASARTAAAANPETGATAGVPAEAAGAGAADAAAGGDRELVLVRAGRREAAGDIEGAIADYAAIYARDSGDPVVANNLASLLAETRDDPASLNRAYAVARRLRGSDVPEFQDTYGWILHRRGDSAGALRALEPAADALPQNALVQYHAGEALLAAGAIQPARARFAAAVALADAAPPGAEPPQIAAARARIAEIDAAAASAPADPEAKPTGG